MYHYRDLLKDRAVTTKLMTLLGNELKDYDTTRQFISTSVEGRLDDSVLAKLTEIGAIITPYNKFSNETGVKIERTHTFFNPVAGINLMLFVATGWVLYAGTVSLLLVNTN